MTTPLQGLRALEIGGDVAVRFLGHMLASLGAEVVRTAGAENLRIGFAGEAGIAYGRWLDAGKRLEAEPKGAFDLILGGLDEASISAARQAQARHGGLLAALRWFDPAGPYGAWTGSDEIVMALAGLAYPFGTAEGPPILAQGHAPQLTAAVVAFDAALAALLHPPGRRPARLDVSVFEAAMCYTETGAIGAAQTGDRSVRLGVNRFVPTYPCSAYRTSDGWVGITCLTPAQWRAMCALVHRPDLAADPRMATSYQRLLLGDEVDAALAPHFPERSQAEWVRLGLEHRIPIAPMDPPGELPKVAHWRARGAFAAFDDSGTLGPALPWRMSFDGVTAEPWTPAPGDGPLAGLRVVDFSMGWAGPICARTLADLGADVIKVESEAHPDWWRGWEDEADIVLRESRTNFLTVNRGKRGVDIDLTTPKGQAQAKALIASADVVVENYAAGVLDKLGLGQAVQRKLRPGIISLSMPAFGAGGPLSGLRAYGSTVEQASGLAFVNGEADWPPALQHVALGDPIAGYFGAAAILAALHARARLGGADIDLAQVAGLFQFAADAIIAEQLTGKPTPRTGSARARLALCQVLPAQAPDDWLAVAVEDEAGLGRLAKATGGENLGAWARERSAQAAAKTLQGAGVAAAPVQPTSSLSRDPQLAACGYFAEMDRAIPGPHLEARSPYRFDGQRPALRAPAPFLGEHTEEVLAEVGAKESDSAGRAGGGD